jgi:hypothetical protein
MPWVGGLISLSANTDDIFRVAAGMVDKVLKAAKPADPPVEQPSTFELIVNLKTARALGRPGAYPRASDRNCRMTVVHVHGDARFGCARGHIRLGEARAYDACLRGNVGRSAGASPFLRAKREQGSGTDGALFPSAHDPTRAFADQICCDAKSGSGDIERAAIVENLARVLLDWLRPF